MCAGRLAKFVPGQSFSLTARRRNDRKDRHGLDFQSELAPEPRPEKIKYGQRRWLFRVNPASEHDEHAVGSRCVLANHVALPGNGMRFGDEYTARSGGRTN